MHYVPRGWTDWMVGLDDGWGGSGGTYSYDNFTQNVNGLVRRPTDLVELWWALERRRWRQNST